MPAASTGRVSNTVLKVVMAVTGTVFIGFVVVHMIGNLKVYLGADDLNHYAAFLRELLVPLVPHGWVLWAFRVVLLICLVAHVVCAAILTSRSRAHGRSRTTRGRHVPWWRSFTSRTMPVSGVLLLAFVIFHILDLTTGTVSSEQFRHPETVGADTEYFAYQNLVASFERPAAALFYVVAMVVLGAHMLHGTWSVIHDLGVSGHRTRQVLWATGSTFTAAVVLGNASIPIAVQAGWVG